MRSTLIMTMQGNIFQTVLIVEMVWMQGFHWKI